MNWLRLDNRYLPPLLITAILLTAHFSFGHPGEPEREGSSGHRHGHHRGAGARPNHYWHCVGSRQA